MENSEVFEKRSSFVPFLETVNQFLKLKEKTWELLQYYTFKEYIERYSILQLLRSLLRELKAISEKGTKEIEEKITNAETFSKNIDVVTDTTLKSIFVIKFKEKINEIFDDIVKLQQARGLGYSTISDADRPFARLFDAIAFPMVFTVPAEPNKEPLLIAPEMFLFAKLLIERTKKKFDNIIFTQGIPGHGKTTFDLELLYTIQFFYKAEGIDAPFNLMENVFVTEKREECLKKLENAQTFTNWLFAEAGNQFSNRRFFDYNQEALVNLVNRMRFHGHTIILEWNSKEFLDKQIRGPSRATFLIHTFRIEGGERGLAIIQTIPEQPEKPQQPITTIEDRINFLLSSPYTLMAFPFYPTPSWLDPNIKKDLSKKVIPRKKREGEEILELSKPKKVSLEDNVL